MRDPHLSDRLRDLAVATSLLTRLPIHLPAAAFDHGARSAWCWPVIGLLLAGLAGCVALIGQATGLAHEISALLGLFTLVVLTGAMHEDGLADVADGFWGGHERGRRLDIMRDSRIGAYGVIALVLGLGLRAMALVSLGIFMIPGLFAAAALSRAAMVVSMAALPHARRDGLSRATGRPSAMIATIACAIALVAALLLTGKAALPAILAVAVATAGAMHVARRKIGGQTGDVLGATQQLSEITALLALSAAL
ncbi:MAG: cobalamin 5'-phosphate synthase [Rhodobacteraceae bacterium HLUCCO07]|nr:MAG: cobalamin 5'-phosphate synthase [Rhodobacteraceae bacterium HLUCCO07]